MSLFKVIFNAAQSGTVEELVAALELHGELIDATNPFVDDQTPLRAAAERGHVTVIEALVRLGSKTIDTPCNNGWTPMLVAAGNGHAAVIEALVRLGSTALDSPYNYGRSPPNWTPFYYAAMNGRVAAMEALIRMGSTAIDTPSTRGITPMHYAASMGNEQVIEALVRLGSQAIDSVSDTGATPLSLTTYNPKCATTLITLGAQGTSRVKVTEEQALCVRYRVYFAHSLAQRLFVILDMPRPFTPSPQASFD